MQGHILLSQIGEKVQDFRHILYHNTVVQTKKYILALYNIALIHLA